MTARSCAPDRMFWPLVVRMKRCGSGHSGGLKPLASPALRSSPSEQRGMSPIGNGGGVSDSFGGGWEIETALTTLPCARAMDVSSLTPRFGMRAGDKSAKALKPRKVAFRMFRWYLKQAEWQK